MKFNISKMQKFNLLYKFNKLSNKLYNYGNKIKYNKI